jgi:protein gp37
VSGETAIGWTDMTWNVGPVGCVHVTDGPNGECTNCYADTFHTKWHRLVEARQDAEGRTYAVWKSNGKRAPVQYLARLPGRASHESGEP